MITTFPKNMVFGISDSTKTHPIINLPPDTERVKIKLRDREFGKAFVKTASAITGYYMQKDGNFIVLVYPFATNSTAK